MSEAPLYGEGEEAVSELARCADTSDTEKSQDSNTDKNVHLFSLFRRRMCLHMTSWKNAPPGYCVKPRRLSLHGVTP